jgi:hypothetical protein
MSLTHRDRASIPFKGVINSPTISHEPIAEFYDLHDSKREEIIRFNQASLEAAIRNYTQAAEQYPKGNARDNLVQLNAARVAFDRLKK